MKVAYLVHDLNDAAVARRVQMLKAGGAEVVPVGFWRGAQAPGAVEGVPVVDLGRTEDAKLLKRMGSVLAQAIRVGRLQRAMAGADVVVARNLEMLLLAVRVAQRRAVIYESLDIHRSLLGSGRASQALRAVERALMRRCGLLIVSSPAFLKHYFEARQGWRGRTLLMENKVLRLDGAPEAPELPRPSAPPWRIGWFGMIRCRKSLALLSKLAAHSQGRIEVVIRGRPARHEFADFDAEVAAAPGVTFEGAYKPSDLPQLYGEVHFAWAIDYFEEGLNSSWLLPNRLYEGPLHGAVPIALREVETGAWLAARNAGLLLDQPDRDLAKVFENLTVADYARLSEAVAAIPRRDLRAGESDCKDLVAALGSGADRL